MDREVKVKEMMTTEVFTLECAHALTLADDLMRCERIRHLPVLKEGKLVGVVSQRDLFHAALAVTLGYRPRAHRMLRRTIQVQEVMRAPAITVSPEALVTDAARDDGAEDWLPPGGRGGHPRRHHHRDRHVALCREFRGIDGHDAAITSRGSATVCTCAE